MIGRLSPPKHSVSASSVRVGISTFRTAGESPATCQLLLDQEAHSPKLKKPNPSVR